MVLLGSIGHNIITHIATKPSRKIACVMDFRFYVGIVCTWSRVKCAASSEVENGLCTYIDMYLCM